MNTVVFGGQMEHVTNNQDINIVTTLYRKNYRAS